MEPREVHVHDEEEDQNSSVDFQTRVYHRPTVNAEGLIPTAMAAKRIPPRTLREVPIEPPRQERLQNLNEFPPLTISTGEAWHRADDLESWIVEAELAASQVSTKFAECVNRAIATVRERHIWLRENPEDTLEKLG